MNSTDTTTPSREEYGDALEVLAAAPGAYTAEDCALAVAWVAEYEAANR